MVVVLFGKKERDQHLLMCRGSNLNALPIPPPALTYMQRKPPRHINTSENGWPKNSTAKIYFGNVMERKRGHDLAAQLDGGEIWQAVWKVVYEDAVTEDLTRLEIIDALKCYL
jgi:hypothetical protein